jgi:ParB family chromosome partitioning protein
VEHFFTKITFSTGKVAEFHAGIPKYCLGQVLTFCNEGEPKKQSCPYRAKECYMANKKQKPKHLGRGLASLLGPINIAPAEADKVLSTPTITANFPPDKELRESLREVSIDSISPNPFQPRMVWNQDELDSLTNSIKANGLVQPIIVRPAGTKFELIAGERRFRAAKLASMTTIPAMVRPATDEQMLELSLIENIHRANLNPIERATAYRNYLNKFSLTQAEAAERLGENRSVVANYLRLLDLPNEIKQMLADGSLTMGHARAILALPTDQLRRNLANRAMAGRLSVREVERLVRKYMAQSGQTKPIPPAKPAHILDLENALSSQIGTKVTIETRKNGQRGKITIEFYSLDEFDRITERIGLACAETV